MLCLTLFVAVVVCLVFNVRLSRPRPRACCCRERHHREMLFEMGLKYPGKEAQIGDLIMSGVGQSPKDYAVCITCVHTGHCCTA